MKRRDLMILMLVAIGCFHTGCTKHEVESYTRVRPDRARLVDPFQSYASVDEVLSLLSRQGIVWEVKEDDRTVKSGERRPPFWLYSIELSDFKSLEGSGKLVLKFFNNRLFSTTFYPGSANTYMEKLRGKFGPNLGSETKLDDKTLLRIGLDYEKKFYVAWEDVRLLEELDRWIVNFA